MKLSDVADTIRAAGESGELIESFGEELTLEQGYEIQELNKSKRLQTGEQIIGVKLGFTSLAKQEQMGLNKPIFGYLTDVMKASESVAIKRFVQPKIEPELLFKLSRPLREDITIDDVADYVEVVAVGLEIIDSRFKKYKFTMADVVADDTSAAAFVVGDWAAPDWQKIADLTGTMDEDGIRRTSGVTSDILGNPRLALVRLSEYVASKGQSLPSGSLILSGAFTDAIPMKVGKTYSAEVESIGSVSIKVVKE